MSTTPPKLSARQRECLRAVADGSLPWVSLNGAGTFRSDPFAPNTYLSLEDRGLVDREQDDQAFWKYHVTLTVAGQAAAAALVER